MNQEKIGKFIQERRKAKKLTQEELSEKLGVNNRSVSRWENGKCMPDLSILKQLSKELDVSINDLLNGEFVDKEKYQETFEENTINLICYLKNHKETFLTITKILVNAIFITSIIIIVMFLLLVINAKWLIKEDYISSIMSVNNYNDLVFEISSKEGTLNQVSRTVEVNDEETTYIFITWNYTLLEKIQNSINDNNGIHKTYLSDEKLSNKFKVYYTKENFNNIIKADENELNNIIENSYLMYEE